MKQYNHAMNLLWAKKKQYAAKNETKKASKKSGGIRLIPYTTVTPTLQ